MTEPSSQLLREIANTERLLGQRMDSMDKAMELARAELTRVPTELDRRIAGLKEVIAHQDNTTNEKIGQQYVLLNSVEKSLDEKYTDLASRLTRIESYGEGRGQVSGPLWGIAAAVLTALIAAGLISTMNLSNPLIYRQIEAVNHNQSQEMIRPRLQDIGK